LDKPLGIIAGAKDRFIPLKTSREMAKILNPKVCVEIEKSGHMPMIEDPHTVVEALKKLIQ
jgi:pimeloyl-ACP methyl ester carboxylesterase